MAFFLILLLVFPVLLLLYQNAGELGPEAPKPLHFPGYFASIYKDKLVDEKTAKSPEALSEKIWLNSPLYRSYLSQQESSQEKPPCDPKNKNQICPPEEKFKPQQERPLTFAVDPLRTLATVKMDDSWEGRVLYDSPRGPKFLVDKQLNEDSKLHFEVEQPTNSGKVSIDISW